MQRRNRAGVEHAGFFVWGVVAAACAAEPRATEALVRHSDERTLEVESDTLHDGTERLIVDASSAITAWIEPDGFTMGPDEIRRWIERSAEIVSSYFGSFPLPKTNVYVMSAPGTGVQGGTTTPADGGTIRVRVGRGVSADELEADWVLVHEMIHLALPSLAPEQHWFEEGAATYVEPIARARAGELRPERVWRDLMRGAPRGLADASRGGLDSTPRWAATYWGGALYFLLADVRIRARTGNERSLADALIAIVEAGGSIRETWPIERVIATADAALGEPVFAELYQEMALRPPSVDLERLWRDLGLSLDHGRVTMSDLAPLAEVRRAITARR